MTYRKATIEDFDAVVQLATKLWPHHTTEVLQKTTQEYFAAPEKYVIYLALDENKTSVGFVMGSIRSDYVEGSEKSPVGYIEGIYVDDAHRHHGIATELVRQVEQWAKEHGCTEIGSDIHANNGESAAFHKNIGFIETTPLIHFIKKI